MRKTTIALLLLTLVAGAAFAADPADEVRQTEMAFAKAFADRDAAAFFSFVAEDANFIGPKKTLAGRAEVAKVWGNMLREPKAPFSWYPERVVVNGNGTIALSTGPVFDAAGKHTGNFSSIWQKQSDGGWKVIFDGPGAPVCDSGAAGK